MAQFFFKISILAFTIISSQSAFAKGWGSSGGGGGVACFFNEQEAAQATPYIQSGKSLPAPLIQRIQSLVTLDYWEWQTSAGKAPLHNFSTNNFYEIVTQVEDRNSLFVSLFIYRLKQSGDLIQTANWQNLLDIPLVNDATLKLPLPNNCRIVQLARRLSNNNNAPGVGPVLKAPEVLVEFNAELFALLNPLNKAILIMHERLYLMGQSLGVNTSDLFRPVVMQFFAENIADSLVMTDAKFSARELRYRLVDILGDYIIYFGDEMKAQGEIGTQASRLNSFFNLNKSLREKIHTCMPATSLEKEISVADEVLIKKCKDSVMRPMINATDHDEETSFLILAYFIYDISLTHFNAEQVIVPLQNPAFLKDASDSLRWVCNAIVTDAQPLQNQVLANKAKAYCRKYGAN